MQVGILPEMQASFLLPVLEGPLAGLRVQRGAPVPERGFCGKCEHEVKQPPWPVPTALPADEAFPPGSPLGSGQCPRRGTVSRVPHDRAIGNHARPWNLERLGSRRQRVPAVPAVQALGPLLGLPPMPAEPVLPGCGVRLTDPLRQTACDVCGEAIEQTAYPAVTSEAPAARDGRSPASATVPPLVPPSQTTAKVEELVGSFRGAGSVRREAADYAAALMASGQLTDALAVLADALAEVGDEPPDAQLLLLRGHCLQSIGRPGPALHDLLASAQADPSFLPSVAPGLQRLLLTADASEFRKQILDSWGPALERQVSSQDHLLLCEIELQAAVLQHDSERALDVVARVQRAHAEVGVARCAPTPALIRLSCSGSGSPFGALARTEAALGLAEEAIADADRAVQLGLSERGAQAALLEFKAGLLSEQGKQAQATSVLRQAGKCAYFENDFKNAVRLLRRTWAMEADPQTGWHLADALRMLAADPADPAGDQLAVLREALEVGERVAFLEPMGRRFSWGYSVLAKIHLDLVIHEPLAGADHQLLAALAAERLLLLEPYKFTLALLAENLLWAELACAVCRKAASRCRAALHDPPDVLWSLGYAQLQVGVPEFTSTLDACSCATNRSPTLRGAWSI